MNSLRRFSIAGLMALSMTTGCVDNANSSDQANEMNLVPGKYTPVFATAGMPAQAGMPASGGEAEQSPGDAESPDDCQFDGAAGQVAIPCDAVTVEFSHPVAMDGLAVTVTTDRGHEFKTGVSAGNEHDSAPDPLDVRPLEIELTLNRDEQAAVGFKLFDNGNSDDASPESITVIVVSNDVKVADTTLMPTYSCNQVATSHWCWEGDPLPINISR